MALADRTPDIRWKQRFSNFNRAFLLLREAMENDISSLNQLEKEGIIQRFEYTFELAWKVLKDKMENEGIVLDKISPKAVIKQAYAAKYIDAPETWLKMVGDRNLLSHTYDFVKFEAVIQSIADEYLPMLEEWHTQLLMELNEL
jgi:nucleotidyltransferase substrate binding protein (TIGR01987 family)